MSWCKEQICVDNAIQSYIDNTADERPFYVADLSDVVKKHQYWSDKLPRVEPFYAIKCNPDPTVLRLMVALGMGFDCASKDEIQLMLSVGASASDIIFAHPMKPISSLRYAKTVGVDLMTFDSEQELLKIKRVFPTARLMIRIKTVNNDAGFCLSDKFGCGVKEAFGMLKMAKNLGLNVVGVSFHVGSLCRQPLAYAQAIGMTRQVFDFAESIGYNMTLLDIGGGFPGAAGCYTLFDKMCNFINQSLDEHFPPGCGVGVIAEPGCYMVCSAFTLYTTVIGKKIIGPEEETNGHSSEEETNEHSNSFNKESDDNKEVLHYYLNESIFGSYSDGLKPHSWFLGFRPKPVLSKSELSSRRLTRSKLWGATCANFDCIYEDCTLPELEIGEVLAFENMGAYSLCIATNFNGFPKIEVYYKFSQQHGQVERPTPFAEFCRELGYSRMKSLLKMFNSFDEKISPEITQN